MSINRNTKRNYIPQGEKKPFKSESWGTNGPFYRSKWWRNRRKAVLLEKPLCVECEKVDITRLAEEVDHREPIPPNSSESTCREYSREENLDPLCSGHHKQKTARERNKKYDTNNSN